MPRARAGSIDPRLRVSQSFRVLVARRHQHLVDWPVFDDLAVFHDDDVVAELPRERQVVGDQHERHATVVAQARQQRQDVALRRDVQGGRRLVGDEHPRLGVKGGRDGDALTHAARQLVRVRAGDARVEADLCEKRT